jgi:hypothetical protein
VGPDVVDPSGRAAVRTALLLSLQRALLGAVPASLRAVTCDSDGTEIKLRFVFDGPIDPDSREAAHVVGTEVAADFWHDVPWTVSEDIVRLDHPADLRPLAFPHWAYARKETSP